jgi:hypothetical protein
VNRIDLFEVLLQGASSRLVAAVLMVAIVGQLHVTGAQYHSPGVIRKQVPELAEGTVPDFNRVQQQLTPLNRTEDRRVQPILRPGRVPGTVDVDLEVKDELPLSGTIEVNNDHGRDTRPWRLVGTARWGNLFQRDHSLSLTAIAVPEEFSQSQVFVGNYSVPLEGGASFSAIAVHSNSSVASLGGTVALGDGNTLGLRWSWPFGQSASALHAFTAGLDYWGRRGWRRAQRRCGGSCTRAVGGGGCERALIVVRCEKLNRPSTTLPVFPIAQQTFSGWPSEVGSGCGASSEYPARPAREERSTATSRFGSPPVSARTGARLHPAHLAVRASCDHASPEDRST